MLPADVPETVDSFVDDDIEPGYGKDVNVAIHFSFGDQQTISNNIIDFAGNGSSDSGNGAYAASIGMLSDTSGAAYEGLQITGNTLNVLAAQSADPEVIRGIWENGHAHSSNITISDNHFYNLDLSNDPTLNLQRTFTVTSHSSATTTVLYADNSVDGANMGWQWYSPANFAGNEAVQITGNTLTNVNTGLLIRSNGVALLSDNTLTNSGAMTGLGIGINIAAGSVVTIDDSVGDNEISGFATGIQSAGTVDVIDNDASIHGNVVGIDVTGGTATISGNHIYDNTTGIRFTSTGGGSVGDNSFDDTNDNVTDIRIDGSAGAVTINDGNQYAGNYYFIDNRSTQAIDLTGHGTATYEGLTPGVLADDFRIEDKVFHGPDDSASGVVSWVADTLFVSMPGSGVNDELIQNAIDVATAGDTIHVEAGTYVDSAQIVVGTDVTIIGEGESSTIFTKNFDTAASGDGRGWWLVQDGVDLNLSDVGFDGSGYLTWQAIRHKGTGTVDNVSFTEIKYNESGPDYQGTAIAYFPISGNLDVNNSMFSEIGRVGVLFFGAGATGTYDGNTYTGKGAGDWLDYAVEVGSGAVVYVTDSTINGNLGEASVDNSTSAGVLVTSYYGPGSEAHISGSNLISGNTNAVVVGFDSSDDSVVTIDGGQFKDNTSDGISIVGDFAKVTIINATVTGNAAAGISASGAEVLIENTTLTGNQVGILVSDDAVIDAGGGGNTSLGTSSGGNLLTGYSGVGGNYAIENQNLDAAGNVDVYAQNNSFGSVVPAVIDQVVYHTNDDPALTEVFFTPAVAPPFAPFPPLVVFVDDDWAGTGVGVDADGVGGASLGNGTAFGYDQFATIEDALAAVTDDGTGQVLIYNGTYYTSGYEVDKAVLIDGETESGVIVAPAGEDDNIDSTFGGIVQHGFIIQSSDVTIQDLTIDGEGNASLTAGKNNFRMGVVTDYRTPGVIGTMDNVVLDNITVLHTYRRAIQFYSGNSEASTGNARHEFDH